MTDATAATNTTTSTVPDGVRFIDGVTAKGKFIGIEDVKEETGDEICNTSMVKLKAVVIAKKEHKLPIFMKISFEGLSIIDAKTNEVLYKHAVEHISYISRDPNDPRAFGYIFKNDKNQLQYIAIKTEKQSAEVVLTLKDLFEVVYEKNKEEKAKAKEAVEKVNEPVQEAPKHSCTNCEYASCSSTSFKTSCSTTATITTTTTKPKATTITTTTTTTTTDI